MSSSVRTVAGIAGLSAQETRVLGCMLEKQRTTPDQYPLSLNALRLACNQSTNRDPVVSYEDSTIKIALHRLERRGLVRLASGSRAAKYRHLLADALPMSAAEQALMCVLMLRGPQTPGELKQRAERMHPFAELADVTGTLADLIARGLVEGCGRRPGQKEDRYAQLLEGDGDDEDDRPSAANGSGAAFPRAPEPEGASHAAVRGAEPADTASTTGAVPASTPAPAIALADLLARVERLERDVAQLRGAAGGEHA